MLHSIGHVNRNHNAWIVVGGRACFRCGKLGRVGIGDAYDSTATFPLMRSNSNIRQSAVMRICRMGRIDAVSALRIE